jgi:dolichol-phosphate mannosyltransferase
MDFSKTMISVVIPTYNEAENIIPLIDELEKNMIKNGIENFEIIVIDDNSPDGTWKLVEERSIWDRRVKLIRRVNERGLASAVIRGLKEAKGEYILVMDADFQHPPEVAPKLIKVAIKERADVVVASRYLKNGGIEGWSRLRLLVSKAATLLAHLMVKESKKTSDPLSGFFVVRKDFVNGRSFRPRGYKILLEIIARDPPRNAKIIDVPYVFKERRRGKSKLGLNTMLDYILHLIDLSKLTKFAIVGGIGTFVNLGVMALVMFVSKSYDLGSACGIETSIITNFILHDFWTFNAKLRGNVLARLGGFHVSSIGSALTTYIVMKSLYVFLHVYPIIGQFLGIIAGFALNYLFSSRVIWGIKGGH